MWDIKSIVLFICSLFVVILLSLSMANAEEKKITPKEFGTAIAETPGKIVNFISSEVDKTKEYQKNSWAEMKTKWPWTMFKGKND
mgnify:FL=1